MNEHYSKWDELAPRGLLLIGLGLSIVGEAIEAKGRGVSFLNWFIKGLVGMIALNSGVALFGEAVKNRTLYEIDIENLRKDTAE
jgi:hypothetical protein